MTILWTSAELRAATGGRLAADVKAGGVCIDTRTLRAGDLFVALNGVSSDGHAYVEEALRNGASCAMVHDAAGLKDDPRLLIVPDTLHGLQSLGQYARKRFTGAVIAVTGSVGKTTTKNMLRLALSAYGPAHAAAASFNNHWGVPLTLARLPRDSRFCICEVGMNHSGEIAPLAAQIRPDIALVTTIGTAHLGHMGSIAAIAREKGALFSALTPGGTALIPDDAPERDILCAMLPGGRRLWQVGFSAQADIRLDGLSCAETGSQFALVTREGRRQDVRLTAAGGHLARNAAMALGAVLALGLDPAPAAEALKRFSPDAGRGKTRRLPGGVLLLDESYNASGPSVRAALRTLALFPATRRLAALGDIRELGEFAEREHRALAEPIMENGVLLFCCGEHMRSLYEAVPPALRGAYAPDARRLAPLLRAALRDGDALLVKGSSASRMRDVITALEAGSGGEASDGEASDSQNSDAGISGPEISDLGVSDPGASDPGASNPMVSA